MKNINWEKVSVYFAVLGFLFMFWSTQNDIKDRQADMRERIATIEAIIKERGAGDATNPR